MSLITFLAVSFLTVLMVGLAIGSARVHAKEQIKKKQTKIFIEREYRTREYKH